MERASSSSSSSPSSKLDDFVLFENYVPVMEHRIDIPAEQQPSTPPRRRFPPYLSTQPVPDVSAATHYRTKPPRRIKLSTISCAIPILILLCFFLLWWFSSPVKVVVKDGRLMDVDTTQNVSVSLKDAYISLKGLLVRSPIPSVTMPDKTEDA